MVRDGTHQYESKRTPTKDAAAEGRRRERTPFLKDSRSRTPILNLKGVTVDFLPAAVERWRRWLPL